MLSLDEMAGCQWQQQKRSHILDETEIVDGVDELGVLLYGHAKNAYWYGSQLSIEETRRVAPYQNATGLQVTSAVLAGMVWALENPTRGVVEADEIDFRAMPRGAAALPRPGCRPEYTDWTPLKDRGVLFPGRRRRRVIPGNSRTSSCGKGRQRLLACGTTALPCLAFARAAGYDARRKQESAMIDLRRRLALTLAAMSILAVTPASAHPHVWVEAQAQVLFDKGGAVDGIRNTWVFDEMYSAFAVQGLEKDGKLATPKDLAPLAETNVSSLAEFEYFTFAKIGGQKLKFGKPVDYSLEEREDKRVVLRFTLPLAQPIRIARFLSFQIYDPTYFVDFELAPKDPVVLAGAPDGCSQSVLGANPLVVAQGQQVAKAFDSGLAPPSDDFALKMASRVIVACP